MNNQTIQNIKSVFEHFYQKGKLETWPNKDYELLSSHIYRETKVLISASTLKRIFGKVSTDENYHPQKATLNALFEYAKTIQTESVPIFQRKYFKILLPVLVLAICFLLFIFTPKGSSEKMVSNSKVQLELNSIEGKNTATAFFSIKDTLKKEFQIYFDDYSDTISLPPNKKTTAHFYKYPGVFYPKIFRNSKKVSNTVPVMVETEDWYAMGTHEDFRKNNSVYPIPNKFLQKTEGYLHPTNEELAACGVDISKISLLRFYNYKDFGINADDFTLNLKLKNTVFWPSVQCNNVIVKIKGSQGVIKQYFSKSGCSFWMENIYGDVTKNGNTEDLSQFCIDLSTWKTIKIKNDDKKISFFQNDTLIDTVEYGKSLGNVLGIEVHFFGTGYLDDFYISANDNSKIFSDDFDLKPNNK